MQHPDVATSQRSGLVFGRFSAYFEPRIGGFKAETPSRKKGGG